jgi:hypothetical protein
MVGTTRPRVSEFLNRFRREGHIEYDHGQIRVRDSLLNVVQRETPVRLTMRDGRSVGVERPRRDIPS